MAFGRKPKPTPVPELTPTEQLAVLEKEIDALRARQRELEAKILGECLGRVNITVTPFSEGMGDGPSIRFDLQRKVPDDAWEVLLGKIQTEELYGLAEVERPDILTLVFRLGKYHLHPLERAEHVARLAADNLRLLIDEFVIVKQPGLDEAVSDPTILDLS